jgi:hypothetical protein
MFVKLLIICVILLSVSGIFLAMRILLKKNGRFPETHVGRNGEMIKRGITCAQDVATGCNPSDITGECLTCGKILLNREAPQSSTKSQGEGRE